MLAMVKPSALQLVVAGAVFGFIITAWIGVLVWWSSRRKQQTENVERRLGLIEEGPVGTRVLRLWQDGQEATISVPTGPQRLSFIPRLQAMCYDAGWSTPIGVLGGGVIGVAATMFVILLAITGHAMAGAAGAATTFMVAWMWLQRAVGKRSELFDRQLVDAMDLAQRSLKAGHPLVAAFQLVAEEIDDPVGSVFAGICEQQELGADLEHALRDASSRCTSEDMRLFATSVAMQTHSGGNLSAMIERLAEVIRDRIKLTRRVRVLIAQTQFSKRVLVALPIGLFVLLNALNPTYMSPLYETPTGRYMLGGAGVSILIGTWVMGRMIKMDV